MKGEDDMRESQAPDVKAPDIERSITNPQFDPRYSADLSPDALLRKYEEQEALSKAASIEKSKLSLQDTVNDLSTPIDGIDDEEEYDITDILLKQDRVMKEDSTSNFDERDLQIQKLEDEIRALKSQNTYPRPSMTPSYSPKQNPWLDPNTGDESWFIRNISNGHVVISDIEMDVIKRGEAVDLLELASIEDIKKSRDLKRAISGAKGTSLLERLTPEQYDKLTLEKQNNEKKIAQYKQQSELRAKNGITPEQLKGKVRGVVLSKMEKLRLSLESATPELGISPVEFMSWAGTAGLTVPELSYILSGVTDREVRAYVQTLKVRAEKR